MIIDGPQLGGTRLGLVWKLKLAAYSSLRCLTSPRRGLPGDSQSTLYEDADNTYVWAELPGLKRDNINVEMSDGYLTINATRQTKAAEDRVTESVSLNRSIAIPDNIASDQIRAVYEDGILKATLPKCEAAKRGKVTVQIN